MANAENILEAAENCARANQPSADWSILLSAGGQIEMVAASGWALESLRRERGAEMAFRVGETKGRIAVEGRTLSRTCRIESETPAALARRLLGAPPAYTFTLPSLAAPKA